MGYKAKKRNRCFTCRCQETDATESFDIAVTGDAIVIKWAETI